MLDSVINDFEVFMWIYTVSCPAHYNVVTKSTEWKKKIIKKKTNKPPKIPPTPWTNNKKQIKASWDENKQKHTKRTDKKFRRPRTKF